MSQSNVAAGGDENEQMLKIIVQLKDLVIEWSTSSRSSSETCQLKLTELGQEIMRNEENRKRQFDEFMSTLDDLRSQVNVRANTHGKSVSDSKDGANTSISQSVNAVVRRLSDLTTEPDQDMDTETNSKMPVPASSNFSLPLSSSFIGSSSADPCHSANIATEKSDSLVSKRLHSPSTSGDLPKRNRLEFDKVWDAIDTCCKAHAPIFIFDPNYNGFDEEFVYELIGGVEVPICGICRRAGKADSYLDHPDKVDRHFNEDHSRGFWKCLHCEDTHFTRSYFDTTTCLSLLDNDDRTRKVQAILHLLALEHKTEAEILPILESTMARAHEIFRYPGQANKGAQPSTSAKM